MGGWRERFARVCVCLSVGGEGGGGGGFLRNWRAAQQHGTHEREAEGGLSNHANRGKMEYRSWF